MCELYLHSSPASTSDHPWLAEFLAHSRKPHDNPDGWGVAFHFGNDAQLFHEAVPAHESELARWVEENAPEVATVVGHIRKASKGGVMLANSQPLSRVIGARRLIFAHNGSVAELKKSARGKALEDRALGTADSEIAMLAFLDWTAGRDLADCVPDFPDFARDMCRWGPFNVIITDGKDTLAHSDRRHHTGDPDGKMRGPGLFMQHAGHSLVLSSEPLCDDHDELPRGTTLHIRDGAVVSRRCEEPHSNAEAERTAA